MLDGISTLVLFIALNVIYLLCCIPIVTIGAATAALFEVMWRFADEERGHMIRGYFSALGRNWRAASVLYLATAVPLLLLVFVATFWFTLGIGFSLVAGLVAVLGAVYCALAFLFGCGLISRFSNTIGQTLKNAYLFPVAQPLYALGALLIPLVTVAMMVIFHPLLFLMATVGVAFDAYLIARVLGSAFRRQERRVEAG